MSYIYVDYNDCRQIAARLSAAAEKLSRVINAGVSRDGLAELRDRLEAIALDIAAFASGGERDEAAYFSEVGVDGEAIRNAIMGGSAEHEAE